MSLTKSFNGTLASVLVAEGTIDETKLVPFYVPELKNSAYADAIFSRGNGHENGIKI